MKKNEVLSDVGNTPWICSAVVDNDGTMRIYHDGVLFCTLTKQILDMQSIIVNLGNIDAAVKASTVQVCGVKSYKYILNNSGILERLSDGEPPTG